jgi:L,D-transpeptidase catalytic domain
MPNFLSWVGAMVGLVACAMPVEPPAPPPAQPVETSRLRPQALPPVLAAPVPTMVPLALPVLALPVLALPVLALPVLAEPRPVRPFTELVADYGLSAPLRVATARRDKLASVKALFSDAGVSFPPAELALRAYKHEREVEVWASSQRGAPLELVTRYGICAASGQLGPKRQEGDGQVPEGFYRIQYLWPNSAFFLSMKVSYPNVSDRRLGHPSMPGSDIMIHGGCASIGCLAMSDERIQEIYLMAQAVQGRAPVDVLIFPRRDFHALEASEAWQEHGAFWSNIYEGHERFERSRRVPSFEVDIRGRYRFASESRP